MKLRYNKRGKQFFFLTLAVDGRRGLLSRLIDDSPRPPLLPLGEAVAAALRALHGLFPSVTASDRVIMPDHFHVVLIINYERDERKSLSPLWLAHRLIDAVELWAARTGTLAPEPPVDREVAPLTVETMADFSARRFVAQAGPIVVGARGHSPPSLPSSAAIHGSIFRSIRASSRRFAITFASTRRARSGRRRTPTAFGAAP